MSFGKYQTEGFFDELFEGVTTSYELVVTFLALLEMAKMRLASIYQTDHEEPIYLEYTLLDATGEPLVPEDVQRPTSDLVDAEIEFGERAESVEDRRESVIVPAGSSAGYTWDEDRRPGRDLRGVPGSGRRPA